MRAFVVLGLVFPYQAKSKSIFLRPFMDYSIREQAKAKSDCIVSSMRSLIHQERVRRAVDFAWLGQCFQCFDTVATSVLRPFFRDHPGEPVPEENFWTYGARED